MDNEKYVKYHQKTELYFNTIAGFENDDSVVLANKIKGLETYLKELKGQLISLKRAYSGQYELNTAIYKEILNKQNFDNVGKEVKLAIAIKPITFVYSKQLDPISRKLEYYCEINHEWLNSYVAWIEQNIKLMKDLLTEKKKETKQKKNEEVKCLCGRTYTLSNKKKHFESEIHKKNMERFNTLNPNYIEPEPIKKEKKEKEKEKKKIGNDPIYHDLILKIINDTYTTKTIYKDGKPIKKKVREFYYTKGSYDHILEQLLESDRQQQNAELEKMKQLKLEEERQRLEDERILLELLRQEEEERKEREEERKEYLKEFYEKQKQEPEIIKPKKNRFKK